MSRFILFLFLISVTASGISQSDPPRVTKKYFIKNAQVITRPGSQTSNTSVLIEDGIITQVGSSLKAPFDAVVIEADSMYVYPAFIAGISTIGVKKSDEKNEGRPKVDRTGYPPNDVAGITPEKTLSSVYNASESSIKEFRESGFAIAHSVPEGGMLPGKGSLISLNGEAYNKSVIKEDVSLFAQFKGANRVFPATTIGVMAKLREMYKNAEISMAHTKAYNINPKNKKRPTTDAATEALYPVVSKSIPVFFLTEEHLDAHRAMQLQKDLGFELILSELKTGTHTVDKIKSNGARVMISLDLPKEEKEKKDDKKEVPDEEKAFTERKANESADRVGQAALMSSSGVPFSYSFLEVKGKEVMPAIRRMIKAGLSEEKALAALTIDAAKALKVDNITGTIEPGKLANIIVATDSIFKEDSQIKMVFVDGVQHTIEVKEKKKGDADAKPANIAGTWNYEIDIPGMTPSGTLTITKNGDEISIVATSNQNEGVETAAENIELNGNVLTFEYTVNTQGMSISVSNEITIDGDSFEGQVVVADFGSFPIKGSKISSPE